MALRKSNIIPKPQEQKSGNASASDLKHILLKNKVISPVLLNVGLYGTSHWSVIVKSTASTMNLEGLSINEPSLNEILQ